MLTNKKIENVEVNPTSSSPSQFLSQLQTLLKQQADMMRDQDLAIKKLLSLHKVEERERQENEDLIRANELIGKLADERDGLKTELFCEHSENTYLKKANKSLRQALALVLLQYGDTIIMTGDSLTKVIDITRDHMQRLSDYRLEGREELVFIDDNEFPNKYEVKLSISPIPDQSPK
jgi:hypothetical protein